MSDGKLIPAFLPIWNWTGFLIDNVKENEHMIFDGLCRRPEEAPILEDRLIKRGRYDDKDEKIAERLKWFETDVMPSVEYFKANSYYNFIKIDGAQAPKKVHEDIVKALGI